MISSVIFLNTQTFFLNLIFSCFYIIWLVFKTGKAYSPNEMSIKKKIFFFFFFNKIDWNDSLLKWFSIILLLVGQIIVIYMLDILLEIINPGKGWSE